MKKYTLIALLAFFAGSQAMAQQALDGQNILKAQKALNLSGNCSDALMYLRMVSDSGKQGQNYVLTMARANDCKSNTEQAIYFYNKFLEKSTGNDSVKKRVAELKDMQVQGGAVKKQEKDAKEYYKGAKKGFNGPCVNEKDFAFGLACDIFTGGTNNPYKLAYNFTNSNEFPFAKNHLLFAFSDYLGYLTGGQKSWFAQTFNTPQSNITKIPGSVQVGLSLSLAYLFVNTHSYAVSVAPLIGFNAYPMPGIYMTSGSNIYSNPIMFSAVTGLAANLYAGKHFYCSLSYMYSMKSTYSNDLESGISTVTPVNENALRIGVGVRGFGFPRYGYHY